MDRLDIINFFVHKIKAESYLEIGVFTGYTLDGCKVKNKIGVDPSLEHYRGSQKTFPYTSDEFFAKLNPSVKFDIIFIDGLHDAWQVKKDLENALFHLSPKGVIIMHDMNPPLMNHTTTGIDGCWTGDCYKAILAYAGQTPFEFYTIDTDWGVGIVKPIVSGLTSSELPVEAFQMASRDWEFFDANRKKLMNIISVEEFLEKENQENGSVEGYITQAKISSIN